MNNGTSHHAKLGRKRQTPGAKRSHDALRASDAGPRHHDLSDSAAQALAPLTTTPDSPAGLRGASMPCSPDRSSITEIQMFKPSSEFARASDDARNALVASSSRRSYGNNEVIYLQEECAQNLHFVVSGHVRLSCVLDDGSAILCAVLSAGDSFGELGVFDGGVQCDTAMAIGNAVVSSIPTKAFQSLCRRFPVLHECIAHLVARRCRSYIELTRIMNLKTLSRRLAQALLWLADGLGTATKYCGRDVPYVGPVVTQAELGLMARGARGSVNRALRSWQRAGWLVVKDRAILISNRAALEAIALEGDI
jgi:CRP/FNR family transcriptional regulator, cyclic AMP receptor protein